MHVHSKQSDDAGGTVEGYLKWINVLRKKGYQVDGLALTEHRSFDFDVDYSSLANQYDAVVIKGAEIETDLGHVLVYGITQKLMNQFNFKDITLPATEVYKAVRDTGGYAIAAHPGRPKIGLWQHIQNGAKLDGIQTVERFNGGSNADENDIAGQVARKYGFHCVGGSDSHYVSTIGKCITRFNRLITSVEELVEELSLGDFDAALLEDTRD
jgi:predicted metal-dependent phosphoesterase TrpH